MSLRLDLIVRRYPKPGHILVGQQVEVRLIDERTP